MRILWKNYRGRRRTLVVLGALLIVGSAVESAGLILIVPLAQAVTSGDDDVSGVGPIHLGVSTTMLGLITAIAIVATLLLRLLAVWVQSNAVIREERLQRQRLNDAYLAARWEFRATEPTGRFQWLSGLAVGYADLLGIVANSARFLINVAVMLVTAVLVSPTGALVIVVVGGLMYVGFRPLVSGSRRAQERAVGARERHDTLVAEVASIGPASEAFHIGERLRHGMDRTSEDVLSAKRTSLLLSSIAAPVLNAAGLLIVTGILAYAAQRPVNVGSIGAVALLLLRSLTYSQGIQNALHKYVEYLPIVSAFESALGHYRDHAVVGGDVPVGPIRAIDLDGIHFSYSEDAEPVLDGVDLHLAAGEHVGIVGRSGAGKTTLVQVLLGLRVPRSGTITINGAPRDTLRAGDLARHIAYVPQHTPLLRATLADNVRFLRDLSDEDVARAVEGAGLGDFARSLADGLATKVGDTDHGLSGGQVQRIGIARALAGNPSVLILDEPTSALDEDTESIVIDTLRSAAADTIVVLIAHRHSTLKHCTRVIVIANGCVAVDGSAQEVLADNRWRADVADELS